MSNQQQIFKTFSNTCNAEKKAINSKLEKLSEENSNQVTKIALLKVELVAAKSAKDQAEKHSSSIWQACEKMKLNQIMTMTAKINKLEAELKATKDEVIKAKSNSESSLISLKEVFDKLEENLNNKMGMKLWENLELSAQLQHKNEQLSGLRHEVYQFDRKIHELSDKEAW